jgi:hypothetical protein
MWNSHTAPMLSDNSDKIIPFPVSVYPSYQYKNTFCSNNDANKNTFGF